MCVMQHEIVISLLANHSHSVGLLSKKWNFTSFPQWKIQLHITTVRQPLDGTKNRAVKFPLILTHITRFVGFSKLN